ncbi:hypothetical protein I5L01_00260 [Erythrobacter sp. YJ-T3-07]|uniref:hypothetical protein n=1 Tax=Erythrobacter sp. YJ-T3-07 TaxID=2793063 RepID=UPI0018D3D9BB|nr:hypothetical protein [Erythrobacter sp. YJ-T3-07]MBH1942650.1 hypothetical protein [Erythrobacter sp. YJ-T3-07]
MLALVFPLALAAQDPAIGTPCEQVAAQESYSGPMDVCDPLLEGANAYSATMRASLTPRPAAKQVMVYQRDGEWFLHAEGYRWEGSLVETRRNDMPISPADAAAIGKEMNTASLAALAQVPYYGFPNVICTDGSTIELAAAIEGARYAARQHSCAAPQQLERTAALFRELAIKYDPAFEGYLSGL